jgi:hypothetical protein
LYGGMQLAGLPGHRVVPAHGSCDGEGMLLLGVGCRVVVRSDTEGSSCSK